MGLYWAYNANVVGNIMGFNMESHGDRIGSPLK